MGVSAGGGDEIDTGLSTRSAEAPTSRSEVLVLFMFRNHPLERRPLSSCDQITDWVSPDSGEHRKLQFYQSVARRRKTKV